MRAWPLIAGLAIAVAWTSPVRAQDSDPKPVVEDEPDPTRLDVERVPPEAIEISRDLYSHGFFIETFIGARGWLTGIGQLSKPGVYANFGFGLEILRWLWIKLSAEGSIHKTDAPRPPSPTAFELVGFVAELRFQIDFTPRFAIWLGGEGGLTYITTDVLATYGLGQTNDLGYMYGGQLGLDWHMLTRHHSIGLAGGARVYPTLDGPDGELAIGWHGAAYLRYVF